MLTAVIAGCNNIKYPDGGYAYPTTIEDSNFYWYPLRDSINKQHKPTGPYDFLYRFFDKPNLSLHPALQETFRFFLVGFGQQPLIIVLTEKQIVIKKGLTDEFWVKDTSRLTADERLLYEILFDVNSHANGVTYRSEKSYDSVRNLYPRIADKKYRRYLKSKAVTIANKQFKYTTKILPLSNRQYRKIVNEINNSGYWQLPYFVLPGEAYNDGFEYMLEANTHKKYKLVSAACINNQRQYAKACQALIDAAGMGTEYIVYYR